MSPLTLLIVGVMLLAMGLGERHVRRLPVSPSLVYLFAGWAAGSLGVAFTGLDMRGHSALMLALSEAVLLLSLFAIGLRLGTPARFGAWRLAIVLASAALLLTIGLVSVAAWALLGLPWAAALLLAAVLSPTDPVLASDVQLRSEQDRDSVRLTLTVEGALNDGTAFPVVMLALAALGVHAVGPWGSGWLLKDLLWPVGVGTLVGWFGGRALGAALQALARRGHGLVWDELLFFGAVTVMYSVAALLHLSTFLAVFACGCALFAPPRGTPAYATETSGCGDMAGRMMAFGGRLERLLELLMVMLIGVALARTAVSPQALAFVAVVLVLARPIAVFAVSRGSSLTMRQQRLVAWFGIRGVGSLFYLFFAIEHGLPREHSAALIDATLLCIAGSIVLHGVSATPLMEWHRRRWPRGAG